MLCFDLFVSRITLGINSLMIVVKKSNMATTFTAFIQLILLGLTLHATVF